MESDFFRRTKICIGTLIKAIYLFKQSIDHTKVNYWAQL